MKKTLFISILAVAALAGACSKKAASDSATAAGETPKVRTATAQTQDVPQTAEFTTTVQPENKNSIAGASGRIKKLFVEVGSRVVKGQKLVQMDDANVANLQVQIANIQTTYNRVKELVAVGGASQQDLDNAKLQLDVAKTNLKTLEENTFLLSPINGVVTARYFDEGDLFAPSQYPIVTVMQINPLKLKINVSESYFTKVKLGMKADVTFDVLAGEKYEGKINLIYPVIEEMTRTFTVEIGLANNDLRVRPGMSGKVTLNFGSERRIVIPDKAVVKQQGTNDRYVYILKADNTVEYKQIQPGKRLGNEYEIISGIAEGEKVVTEGNTNLIAGSKVVSIEN
jgi:RND family efflux transporter MFP subunit